MRLDHMKVNFVKMHGAGNDFVVVDEWTEEVVPEEHKPDFVRSISERHFGVGSDEVMFIHKSRKFDARFVFYNPDGTKVEMSGNGIRCLAKYAHDSGYTTKNEIEVETPSGIKDLLLTLYNDKVEQVRVDMGEPQLTRGLAQVSGDPRDTFINQEVNVDGVTYKVTAVGMGNPHAIIFVGDAAAVDVKGIGTKIRYMTDLFPHGTNVHFVQQKGGNEFTIRSYERGVEDETLACGTGICAAAVAATLNRKADAKRTFKFHTKGGDLNVKLECDGERFSRVYLKGPAAEVYRGEYNYDPLRRLENAAAKFIANYAGETMKNHGAAAPK